MLYCISEYNWIYGHFSFWYLSPLSSSCLPKTVHIYIERTTYEKTKTKLQNIMFVALRVYLRRLLSSHRAVNPWVMRVHHCFVASESRAVWQPTHGRLSTSISLASWVKLMSTGKGYILNLDTWLLYMFMGKYSLFFLHAHWEIMGGMK